MDTEFNLENQYSSRTEKKKDKKTNHVLRTVVLFLIALGVWTGIVYFGYTYAKDYVDNSIKNVQQENAMNIKELNEQIKILQTEIRNLSGSMENAGLTISNTSGVQERIDEKLKSLDSQLKKLENSLRILKEAP